jgi:NAD-dependent deacetylase
MTTEQVRAKIAASRRICGFTGAGISTESGIPDFRSPGGVWSKYRTVYFDEFMSSREARVEYWRQKAENWPHIRDAQPNAGHFAFAQLEHQGRLRALITQNIDGLHQKAGSSRDKVIELHGTTIDILCLSCGDITSSEEAIARIAAGDLAPECRLCGGYLKPATISFGQAMPEGEMRRAVAAAADCDIFVAAGSSLVVQPAAGIPALAKSRGATLVIVNRDPTPLDDMADLVIQDEIGKALPELLLTPERLQG